MTDLTGKLIANTYKDILTIAASVENSGIDSTLRRVQDGGGNNSPLKLSESAVAFTGNVSVNGNLIVNGSFQPDTVNTNELQATTVSATNITTNNLTAETLIFQDVSVSSLRTGNLYAANISAGTVSATNINATNITVAGDNVATSSALASVNNALVSVNNALVSVEAVISSNIVFVLNAQASVLTVLAGLAATDVNLQNNINSVSATTSANGVLIANNSTQINILSTSITANESAITSINNILGDGSAYASAGTSATLETRIAGVSSTLETRIASTSAALTSNINTVSATLSSTNIALQTSIANSNSAIATLSATMATSIGNQMPLAGGTFTGQVIFNDNGFTVNSNASAVFNGPIKMNSSILLGNSSGDTITGSGRWGSDIIPNSTTGRDLGTDSLRWDQAYINTFRGGIDAIQTSVTNLTYPSPYGKAPATVDYVTSAVAAKASVGTSATLETRIAAVSALIPTSLTELGITDGTAGQVLQTDGNSVFTFVSATGGANIAAGTNIALTQNGVTVTETTTSATINVVGVASIGTSAALESRIATVSSTMATSIANSNSAITALSATMATSIATRLALAGGTMTGNLILNADPSANLQAASKQYVDNLTASSIHIHEAVRVETNGTNLNATYNNGSSGVGATLTNAGTQAALAIDGVTLNTSDRVLVMGQTNQTQNGVYVVTNTGSGSTNWILTRSDDADTSGDGDANSLDEGSYFFVQEGTIGAAHAFVCNTQGTIVFGTTNINFAQFSDSVEYTAGTGINVNASRVISTSGVATTGQLTALSATMATSIGNSNTNITTNAAAITSINGVLGSGAFASAGTSATLQTKINAVSATMATSIANVSSALGSRITTLSATMATSIANVSATLEARINAVSAAITTTEINNFYYTATTSQTTFSGADSQGNTLSYTPGHLLVTLNGLVLDGAADYTATTGSSIVLSSPSTLNDELNVVAFEGVVPSGGLATTGGTITGSLTVNNNLTVDTNTLVVDSTNNKVGIGTSSPSSPLTISSTDENHILLENGSESANIQLRDSGNMEIIYKGSGNKLKFMHDTDERMRLDDLGNLGIGTTSLQNSSGFSTLSINGTTGGQIAFQTGGTSESFIYSDASDFYFYNSNAGNLKFYTSGTERMRINSSGNVTIGGNNVLTNIASSNASTSGYIKLSNGLIIQWGRVTSTSTPSARSFPITFPSNCTSVVATSRAVYYDVYVTSFNTSSFTPTVRYTTGGGNAAKDIFYIAMGY